MKKIKKVVDQKKQLKVLPKKQLGKVKGGSLFEVIPVGGGE